LLTNKENLLKKKFKRDKVNKNKELMLIQAFDFSNPTKWLRPNKKP
jgi:hypothetical protein